MLDLLTPRGDSQDDADFAQRCEELARENVSLQVKVAKLQKENQYLRRVAHMKPQMRLAVRAEAAAQLLALWHCAGLLTGRRATFAAGMSQDTFYAGRALLVLAGVHDGRQWTNHDPALIERQIQEAAALARRNPVHLIRHMPPSKRPKRW